MINKVFLVVSLISLALYLFGILTSIINVEENSCSMTYMFEYPQFVRVHFPENDLYPKYALYAYSEGHLTENARNMHFNGAPVLFIPGNSGSYKQARSLASVALRKGIDNEWIQHLDYFTVDLNGEYSALFGGVLDEQTQYLTLCIKKILQLYKKLNNPPRSLVLIGHSMGGKIAQALATEPETLNSINTIITLAAPMDRPVISMDNFISNYYSKVDGFWANHRAAPVPITNVTNFCRPYVLAKVAENTTKLLDEKLLVTIGSGSRDLMVHPALTSSKYSDIHVLASKVPGVWLSTDHQSSVWCLQLVMTINRFLYSIIKPFDSKKHYHKGQDFIEDKQIRLAKAKKHFNPNEIEPIPKEVVLISGAFAGDWIEDSRRVFTEYHKSVNKTRYQMIRLINNTLHKYLKVEAINLDTDDWVFGCQANEIYGVSRYCSRAESLTHFATPLPSLKHKRTLFAIDLEKLKMKYPHWTHVVLRISPTKDPIRLNVDVHNPADREVLVTMPKWYEYSTTQVLDDTVLGSSYYVMKIDAMEEAHQTLEVTIRPRSCSKERHHAVVKVCVPWTNGCERYQYFTDSKSAPLYIYAATEKPKGFNTTTIPIRAELHLDPACRYRISVKNSLPMTMARIVQQNSVWVPAHLVAVMLLVLKHQITVTPLDEPFKCGSFATAILRCSPFFIVTASRVFAKLVLFFKFLPAPESYDYPISVSILIHGTAVATICVATAAAWGAICFCGNAAHKILFKIIHMPIPTMSSTVIAIIEKFPMSVGVFFISLSMASCGGVGLLLATLVYFILLTKMYEDYLEEFVFKTAKQIAEKLFGKQRKKKPEEPQEENVEDENEANIETPRDAIEVRRNSIPNGEVSEDEDEADLERLIQESIDRYREQDEKQRQEREAARVEYDSVVEGLSSLHFHLSLFFLLLIATLLNLPTVVTWAKNYSFSPILKNDPSIIPTNMILLSLCIIWQLDTPRNLLWYKYFSYCLYTFAVISVLYCQESVWRLSYLIAVTFILIAIHQLAGPKFKPSGKKKFYRDPRFHIRELERMLEDNKKRSRKRQKTPKEPIASTSSQEELKPELSDTEGNREDLGAENTT